MHLWQNTAAGQRIEDHSDAEMLYLGVKCGSSTSAILEPTTDLDVDWEPNPVLTEALGKSGLSMYLWQDKKV